jgi:hypothetical protein
MMPRTIIVETYHEFAARHGGNQALVDGWLVFPSGARVRAEDGDVREEPPEDPLALLQIKRAYEAAALEVAIEEFNKAKADFMEQAALSRAYRNVPPPPADAPNFLKQVKALIKQRRKTLKALDEQLAKFPGPESLERQQAEADRQARVANLRAAIAEITL